MTEREHYDIWAPPESPWAPWAKPVLFTEINALVPEAVPAPPSLSNDALSHLSGRRFALIFDLAGGQSVEAGLQTIRAGYRPVPLFNTSFGFDEIVPVGEIIRALRRGTELLQAASLAPEAPPAFLLDRNRLQERALVTPGKYDNRWLVFPQDFPSGHFLRSQSIDGVVLVQPSATKPREDLAHVMVRWQEEAIPLFSVSLDQSTVPAPIFVAMPSRYRALWYQFLAVLRLRRNSAGGFGAVVPTPSQSGGGFA